MLKNKTEYTPGQMIRFEAIALHHNASRLQKIILENQPKLDFLEEPANAGMDSVTKDKEGQPSGINRKQEHYENLIETLERAREEVERLPPSENAQQTWRLLNRCCYHCMTIIGTMERSAAAAQKLEHPARQGLP